MPKIIDITTDTLTRERHFISVHIDLPVNGFLNLTAESVLVTFNAARKVMNEENEGAIVMDQEELIKTCPVFAEAYAQLRDALHAKLDGLQ